MKLTTLLSKMEDSRKRTASQALASSGPAAKEYALTGAGTTKQESTQKGWRSALKQADVFLATKNLPLHNSLLSEQLTVKLFQECGTFLSFEAVGDDGMPLSLGSAWQYIGSIKNYFKTRFPDNIIYREQSW